MSRIGKKIIELPKGVDVTTTGDEVKVKGPKGTLGMKLHSSMKLVKSGTTLKVEPKDANASGIDNFHGLTRSLVSNMIHGVSVGFSKSLVLKGVGYRAALKGRELQLTLGYSHPVNYQIPTGIEIKVDKQTDIVVSGADKCLVGQCAADIRSFRAPEPYHGKGVRYSDEVIVTKVGKASGKK